MWSNFFISDSTSFVTGIPVHFETTSSISVAVTSSFRSLLLVCSLFWQAFSFFSSSRSFPYLSSAALCKSVFLSASSIWVLTLFIASLMSASDVIDAFSFSHWAFKTLILLSSSVTCFVISSTFAFASSESSFFNASRSISSWIFWRIIVSISSGIESISIRNELAASSIKSIALSGRNLSVIYLSDNFAASIIALSSILTPWWTSYFSFKPRKILIVSSTDGSLTITGWKRLSNAGSFSMYFLYSLIVVAPIVLKTPRANIGFSKLPASIEPSVEPAPTTVCNSSMNMTISPFEASTSFNTAFKRSSNSPLNFAPATNAPKSRDINLTSLRLSGTSPLIIRWANPSTIAVLPTPGSPISTGLFFVRLFNTWIILLTSSSLPITGSSFPFLAKSVRSVEYFSKAFIFSSAFFVSTLLLPLISFIIFSIELDVTSFALSNSLILLLSSSVIARRIDSMLTKSSFNFLLSSIASSNNLIVSWLKYKPWLFTGPDSFGKLSILETILLINPWFNSFNSVK